MNPISEATALDQLQEKWRFDEDRSERILEIARRVGPNSEPVTGGLITITYRGRHYETRTRLYTIEDFTGERVARQKPVRYSKTRSSEPSSRTISQERRPKMPPAKTRGNAKPAAAPAPEPVAAVEPEEVAAPNLATYLDKPFSPTMSDYADWAAEEFGENVLAELTWDRLLVLGSQMYPHFQKSDLNIERKAARKAARDAAVAANGAAETEAPAPARAAAPAKPRGRGKPTPATAAY